MTTGRPALHVAGMAVTRGAWSGPLLPVRAAYAALDDAALAPADISAVIHVGVDGDRAIAAAVRDGIGAASCRRTYDVGGGAAGFVTALAVGASLLATGTGVLITETEPDGAASLILTEGTAEPTTTDEPFVVRASSPIAALLSSRDGGNDDVLLVAPGAAGASVRCLISARHPHRA